MLRLSSMAALAIVLLGANLATAQPPAGDALGPKAVWITEPGEYWLGIECFPVPPTVRAQLNLPEKEGLLVGTVVPDSPAAKAGIVQHDILLRAGDKPLAELGDLVQAVQAAKEGKLSLEVIHGGQHKTVEVAPAKRPAGNRIAVMPAPGDWRIMQKWLEQWQNNNAMPGAGQGAPLQFKLIRPGTILPPGALAEPPLPPNVSVTITKADDQPLRIVVKRGDKVTEATADDLDKLPADVRPFVEHFLGRSASGTLAPETPAPPAPSNQSEATVIPEPVSPPQPAVGPLESRLEKRLEAMDRRIDKLMQALEKMGESHPQPKSPEEHGEK